MASKQAAGRGPGAKRKRVVLTLKEKMDICARLEKGESRKALMQEYNVGMSTLYDIRAHKAQLLRFFAGSASHKALERRRTLHTPKLERLDRVLHEWFLGRRAEGVPVSGPMLIEKAKDLYAQMRLTEPCVFSGGWLWRFKARHGIKKLDASSEKQAADRQAAEQFCGFFRSLTAEHGLTPEQVYNADETGLSWRCWPGPEGGQRRDRLTVLMCANATGSHRIKPLVIGKCGGPRAPKSTQHVPVAHRSHGHAWADRVVFSDWFRHIFAPAVREHFRALGLPEGSKAVLLLDGARARPQEPELVCGNICTVFLPAGAAALLQPMDRGIRRGFLRHFLSPPGRRAQRERRPLQRGLRLGRRARRCLQPGLEEAVARGRAGRRLVLRGGARAPRRQAARPDFRARPGAREGGRAPAQQQAPRERGCRAGRARAGGRSRVPGPGPAGAGREGRPGRSRRGGRGGRLGAGGRGLRRSAALRRGAAVLHGAGAGAAACAAGRVPAAAAGGGGPPSGPWSSSKPPRSVGGTVPPWAPPRPLRARSDGAQPGG